MKSRSLLVPLLTALVLLLPTMLCTGCQLSCSTGDTSGAEGITTTAAAVAQSVTTASVATPTTAAATSSSTAPSTSATTATTGATTTTTQKPTTTTATTSSPTGTTLAQPPTSSTSLIIISPTITLDTVAKWIFQETDSHMNWAGAWNQAYSSIASGGGYKVSLGETSVFMQFEGDDINVAYLAGPDGGIVKVILDGVDRGTVDLYEQAPEAFWITESVASYGSHWLRIESTGTKNPQSTGYAFMFDAVRVYNGKLVK